MSDKLSPQQRKFAEVYAETNDAVAAYKAAYGEEKANSLKYLTSTALHKLETPKIKALIEEIQQGVRAQYVIMAPEAFKNLVDLANNAESEKVRLEANKEILYGGGFKPPEEVQLKHIGIFGGTSLNEMRNMIRQKIEEELAPDAKN